MPTIKDSEFGEIVIRRSPKASSVKLRVAPDGRLRISMPLYAPIFLAKQLVKSNREELRRMLETHDSKPSYEDGMQIGKSHRLNIVATTSKTKIARTGLTIMVALSVEDSIEDSHIVRSIRDETIKALRIEAKSYLPRRLDFIAKNGGFKYSNLRFSHSGGRWGSCNSKGTISLNIGLMKLPFELIDYVLVHELSHTVEMNHSPEFWKVVARSDPNYKTHRKILKTHSPSI
jgi:hypothetical protein